jgi:hypothetical protein
MLIEFAAPHNFQLGRAADKRSAGGHAFGACHGALLRPIAAICLLRLNGVLARATMKDRFESAIMSVIGYGGRPKLTLDVLRRFQLRHA